MGRTPPLNKKSVSGGAGLTFPNVKKRRRGKHNTKLSVFFFFTWKVGSPKGWGPEGVGARRVGGPKGGGPKFSCFFSPHRKIRSFLLSRGSSHGILVVFEAPGDSVHVWA